MNHVGTYANVPNPAIRSLLTAVLYNCTNATAQESLYNPGWLQMMVRKRVVAAPQQQVLYQAAQKAAGRKSKPKLPPHHP